MLHISHYHFFKIFLFSASSFSLFLAFSLSPFFPLLSSSYWCNFPPSIFTIHFSHHPSLPYYLHLIYVSFHYHYALYIFYITRLYVCVFTLFRYLSTTSIHHLYFTTPVFTLLSSPYFCFYLPSLFCIHNLHPPSLHYCLHLIFISIHIMIHFPLAANYVIQRCSGMHSTNWAITLMTCRH